jgi:hypothetical protein
MAEHSHPPAIRVSGLQDGCPRCAEHAAQPFSSLDDDNLRALVNRTRGWMRDEPGQMPRSENERAAMRVVETALQQARTLARLAGVSVG